MLGAHLLFSIILSLLCQGYSQTVYFDWCVIPHTTVCKHTAYVWLRRHPAAMLMPPTWRCRVNCCRQNNATIGPTRWTRRTCSNSETEQKNCSSELFQSVVVNNKSTKNNTNMFTALLTFCDGQFSVNKALSCRVRLHSAVIRMKLCHCWQK